MAKLRISFSPPLQGPLAKCGTPQTTPFFKYTLPWLLSDLKASQVLLLGLLHWAFIFCLYVQFSYYLVLSTRSLSSLSNLLPN